MAHLGIPLNASRRQLNVGLQMSNGLFGSVKRHLNQSAQWVL